MIEDPAQLIAAARRAAFVADPGSVATRLDAAIAVSDAPVVRGELLLARAILHQGHVDLDRTADDCREAYRELESAGRTGSAALAAAVGAAVLHRSGDLDAAVDMAVNATVLADAPVPDADSSRAANALAVFYGEIASFELAVTYATTAFHDATSDEVKEIAAFTSSWVTTEALQAGVDVDLHFAEEIVQWLETESPTDFGKTFFAPNARVELALATGDDATIAAVTLDESLLDDVPPRIASIHRTLLGIVAHHHGDLDGALRHLDVAIPELVSMDNQHRLIRAYRERSYVRAAQGDLTGALADARAEADYVRSIQIEYVEKLAGQIATRSRLEVGRRTLLVRAEALAEAVDVDSVTSVGSRRWLESALDDLAGRTGRSTVAMFDLDHFKDINDRFGHATGDIVLARVGSILASCSDQADLVARYGGEEFTVVFPGRDVDAAVEYAECVRHRLAGECWTDLGDGIEVRVSVGVASGEVAAVRSTLDMADRAMYAAKENGRNRIAVA